MSTKHITKHITCVSLCDVFRVSYFPFLTINLGDIFTFMYNIVTTYSVPIPINNISAVQWFGLSNCQTIESLKYFIFLYFLLDIFWPKLVVKGSQGRLNETGQLAFKSDVQDRWWNN